MSDMYFVKQICWSLGVLHNSIVAIWAPVLDTLKQSFSFVLTSAAACIVNRVLRNLYMCFSILNN